MGFAHVIAFSILIAAPIWGYWKDQQLLKQQDSHLKIKVYYQLAALLFIFSFLAAIVFGWSETLFMTAALSELSWIRYAMYVSLSLFILLNVLPLLLLQNEQFRMSVQAAFAQRSHIYPHAPSEKKAFVFVAVCVGIGEEILFRSFLVLYLFTYWFPDSLGLAVIIANGLFALMHYHQGVTGIFNALLAGLSFSLLFIITGSLFIPIVVHIAYDLKVLYIAAIQKRDVNKSIL